MPLANTVYANSILLCLIQLFKIGSTKRCKM